MLFYHKTKLYSPGQIIRYRDIGDELGIHRHTVSKYLQILEETLLIRKLYNFLGNVRKTEKKSKRYYIFYPTLIQYVSPYLLDFGRQAESEVAFQLDAQYFSNEKGKEIDFIIGKDLSAGVEVKMKNAISKRDIRWLLEKDLKHRYLISLKNWKFSVSKKLKILFFKI